jgi:5-enolpyruvylshikimate-3-phosphate synthase
MAQTVDVTLTTKGADTANFIVTALDTAGATVSAGGWPKTAQAFTQGVAVRYSDVPDAAYQVSVASTGTCTNLVTLRFKS